MYTLVPKHTPPPPHTPRSFVLSFPAISLLGIFFFFLMRSQQVITSVIVTAALCFVLAAFTLTTSFSLSRLCLLCPHKAVLGRMPENAPVPQGQRPEASLCQEADTTSLRGSTG